MAKQMPKRSLEKVGLGVTGACVALVTLVVVALIFMVAQRGLSTFFKDGVDVLGFFTGTDWNLAVENPETGLPYTGALPPERESLDAAMRKRGIIGISGVDTRSLTLRIRQKGSCNAVICSEDRLEEARELLSAFPAITERDLITGVAVMEKVLNPDYGEGREKAPSSPRFSIAVVDFGIKTSIVTNFYRRGCAVTLFPPSFSSEDILSGGYDMLFLSNGPGDPALLQQFPDPVFQERMRLIQGTVQRDVIHVKPCLKKRRQEFLRAFLRPRHSDSASLCCCLCQSFSQSRRADVKLGVRGISPFPGLFRRFDEQADGFPVHYNSSP